MAWRLCSLALLALPLYFLSVDAVWPISSCHRVFPACCHVLPLWCTVSLWNHEPRWTPLPVSHCRGILSQQQKETKPGPLECPFYSVLNSPPASSLLIKVTTIVLVGGFLYTIQFWGGGHKQRLISLSHINWLCFYSMLIFFPLGNHSVLPFKFFFCIFIRHWGKLEKCSLPLLTTIKKQYQWHQRSAGCPVMGYRKWSWGLGGQEHASAQAAELTCGRYLQNLVPLKRKHKGNGCT